jgi:hypothetical protein
VKAGVVRRLNADELTRLAFVWAEQDRAALADAWPYGSEEHEKAKSEYLQLKAYRLKRWGRTQTEAILLKMKTVRVSDLKAV